jgi:signal transduction histidine kinase
MNPFAVAGLITGIFCLILALMALIYGQNKLHRLLMLFNLSVGIWGFGTFFVGRATSATSALSAWKFACVGAIFIPVFFYHMVCAFSELYRKKSIIFAYLQGIGFLSLLFLTDSVVNRTRLIFGSIYYNDATRIFYPLIAIWLTIVCLSFYELFRYLKGTEGGKRQLTLYLFFGSLIGFLGGTSTILPMFHVDVYPIGNFTIPIYCLVITYAILKHRLMNIKVEISNVSISAMFFTLILGIPLGLVFMNPFAVAGLLLGITSLLLALIVFVQGRTKLHLIWVFFNLAVAIWGFGCFIVGNASNESVALLGWRFAHVGGIFVAVFFYHMVYIFSGLKRRKSLIAVYLIGLFFLLLNVSTNQLINRTRFVFNLHYNDATWPFSVLVALWILLVAWSFIELLRFLPKTRGVQHTQTLYIIFGFLIGFLGGISTFFPEFQIDFLYPFGNFTIPLYCLIVTYAILRYNLLNISIVFKRTAAYSLSAGLLTGLFVVLVMATTNLLSTFMHVDSFKISIIAAIIIAILFNPLRNRIQILIDKMFYKKSYDYYAIIQQVSSSLVTMFELEKILQYLGNVINESMGLKDVYLLTGASGGSFDVACHISSSKDKNIKKKAEHEKTEEIRVNKFSGILKFYKTSNTVLIKDELPNHEENLGQETVDRIRKDLEVFHGEAVVPVFLDEKLTLLMVLGGKISGDIFTNEDINLLNTISVQTAIALKNARLYQEKIKSERLASIGMMSATFAHEIRNPLTSLKTFAQLMPEKYNDIEFRDTFSKIVVGEIEKIDGLISDLLDFSSNKKPTRVNSINLTELLDNIVDNVKGKLEFEKSNIVVEKNYSADAINMSGDEVKLKQAFSNIIINGCQAMHGEGVLRIDIKNNGKHFDVTVEDTGEGIHPEDLPKIFDPFITTKERGIGLGLAISKRVIEDHKGKIHIKSQLSKGTTFSISLPVQNE